MNVHGTHERLECSGETRSHLKCFRVARETVLLRFNENCVLLEASVAPQCGPWSWLRIFERQPPDSAIVALSRPVFDPPGD